MVVVMAWSSADLSVASAQPGSAPCKRCCSGHVKRRGARFVGGICQRSRTRAPQPLAQSVNGCLLGERVRHSAAITCHRIHAKVEQHAHGLDILGVVDGREACVINCMHICAVGQKYSHVFHHSLCGSKVHRCLLAAELAALMHIHVEPRQCTAQETSRGVFCLVARMVFKLATDAVQDGVTLTHFMDVRTRSECLQQIVLSNPHIVIPVIKVASSPHGSRCTGVPASTCAKAPRWWHSARDWRTALGARR